MKNNIKKWWKQLFCNHSDWYCDKQIRVIRCVKCGKESWIKDFIDLYSNTDNNLNVK